jgi:hypothetical protein
MPFGCGRPYLQGAPLVGFLCFADDLSDDALSHNRPSGRPSLTIRPGQPTMSAIRGGSTVTDAGR